MRMVFKITAIVLVISFVACDHNKNQKKVVVTKEMLMKHNRKLIGLETNVIQKYVDENQLEMKQSTTGLWYRFVIDSLGMNAKKGQVVYLDYSISLLNDQVCYSSDQDDIWSIVVGKGEVETGLLEALLMASEGDSLQLILPPHLAYGLTGDGDRIPGKSILKYNLRILKIENLPEK